MLSTAEKQITQQTLLHEVNAGQPCLKCEDKCPGLEIHFWRKICINCKCPVSDHAVTDDEGLIQVKRKQLDDNVRAQFECGAYSWIPPGLTAEVVEEYMKLLPPDRRPLVGGMGEQLRRKLLMTQLPAHDHNPKFCNNLQPTEAEELVEFSRLRYDLSYGVAEVKRVTIEQSEMFDCRNCCTPLDPIQLAIYADRAGPSCIWCPACFVCDVCNEALVDLHYFYKDGGLYCGRHHAELLKPRCAACDELILSKEYTLAEQKNWHLNHFCCWNCDSPLGGSRYVTREDHPFCMDCYEELYAPTCEKCCCAIGVDSAQMVHKSHHWHATDSCFYCENCEESLITRPFLLKFGEIFCSSPCAQSYSNTQTETVATTEPTPVIKIIEDNPVDKDLPSILRKDSSPTPPNGVSPVKRRVMFNVMEEEARSMSVEEFERLEQSTEHGPLSPDSESSLSLSPISDPGTPDIEITSQDKLDKDTINEDKLDQDLDIQASLDNLKADINLKVDDIIEAEIIREDEIIPTVDNDVKSEEISDEEREVEVMQTESIDTDSEGIDVIERESPDLIEPNKVMSPDIICDEPTRRVVEPSKTPDISEMVDVMDSLQSEPEQAVIEQAVIEESVIEQAVIEESVIEESVVEQAMIEQAMIEQAVIEQAVIEQAVIEESVYEELIIRSRLESEGDYDTVNIPQYRAEMSPDIPDEPELPELTSDAPGVPAIEDESHQAVDSVVDSVLDSVVEPVVEKENTPCARREESRNSAEIVEDEIKPRKPARSKLSSASFNRVLKKIDCSGNEISLERPGKRLRNRPRSLSSLSSHHKGPLEQKECLVSMYALSPDIADMVASVYKSQNSVIKRQGSVEIEAARNDIECTPQKSPACSTYSSPRTGERSAHKRNPSYEAAEFVMQLDAESDGEEEKVEIQPLAEISLQGPDSQEPTLKKSKSIKGRLSFRKSKKKVTLVEENNTSRKSKKKVTLVEENNTSSDGLPKKRKDKKACSVM